MSVVPSWYGINKLTSYPAARFASFNKELNSSTVYKIVSYFIGGRFMAGLIALHMKN